MKFIGNIKGFALSIAFEQSACMVSELQLKIAILLRKIRRFCNNVRPHEHLSRQILAFRDHRAFSLFASPLARLISVNAAPNAHLLLRLDNLSVFHVFTRNYDKF